MTIFLGGHCKPDLHNRPSALLASHGVDAASELAAFESRNLKAVKKLVEDEKIDCDFVLTRAVEAIMEDSVVEMKKSAVENLRNAGTEGMDDLYFATGVEAERVRCASDPCSFLFSKPDIDYQIIDHRYPWRQRVHYIHLGAFIPVQAHNAPAFQGC